VSENSTGERVGVIKANSNSEAPEICRVPAPGIPLLLDAVRENCRVSAVLLCKEESERNVTTLEIKCIKKK
jgi:hypothetical protein